jgi:hypothetical protein
MERMQAVSMRIHRRENAATGAMNFDQKARLLSRNAGWLMDVAGPVRPDPGESQQYAAWTVAALGLALEER